MENELFKSFNLSTTSKSLCDTPPTECVDLDLIEWEYFNDKMIQEISIIQLKQNEQDKTINLISFIHKKHPNAKIEVKFKIENRNLN